MPFRLVGDEVIAELPIGPESFVDLLGVHGNKQFQFWVYHPEGFIINGKPQLSPDLTMFPDYLTRQILEDARLPDDPPVLHQRAAMDWETAQRFTHPVCGRLRKRHKLIIQVPRPSDSLILTFRLDRIVDIQVHNFD